MRVVAVAFLSLLVIWWIGANVFLSTALFETVVDGDPESVDIHFARAWSLWPGRAHAEHLSIRGKDSNVEWVLELDEVDFGVSLPGLFQKRFLVSYARGSGIVFRGRRRVESPLATPEYSAALPPIPGFGEVAFPPQVPKGPEVWSDVDWKLWTIHLKNVVAEHVREIWVDEGRFQGDARITGGFFLKPIRRAIIGPIAAEVRHGGVTLAGKPVAEDLVGPFGGTVEAFDPRLVHGADIFHYLDLETDFRLRVPAIENLRVDARGDAAIDPLTLRVKHGTLESGTAVDAAVRLNVQGVDVAVDADAHVAGPRGVFRAEVLRAAGHGIEARHASVSGEASSLYLEHLGEDAHLLLDAPDVVEHRHHLQGRARAEGWIAQKRVNAEAHATAKDATVEAKRLAAMVGKATVDAVVDSYNYGTGRVGYARGVLRADLVSVKKEDIALATVGRLEMQAESRDGNTKDPLERLSVRGVVSNGRVGDVGAINALLFPDRRSRIASDGTFRARFMADVRRGVADAKLAAQTESLSFLHDRVQVRGDVDGAVVAHRLDVRAPKFDDLGFDIDVKHVSAGGDPQHPALTIDRVSARGATRDRVALEIVGGVVPDARSLNTVFPAGSPVHVESGEGRLEGFLFYDATKDRGTGSVTVDFADAGVALNEARLRGAFRMEARLESFDRERRSFDLGGSRLLISGLRLDGTSADTKGWEGVLDILRCSVELGHEPKADALLRVDARDASPILGVLLRDKVPKIAVDAVKMPDLRADLRLELKKDSMALRDVMVTGGDVGVQGNWRVERGEPHGTFLVRKGPISVGLGIDPTGSYVRLFDLEAWAKARR